MLKNLCIESAEPKKGVVRVSFGGKNRAELVGKHELDGVDNNDGGHSVDSKGNSSNAPKLICLLVAFTLMLRMSLLTASSTSAARIEIEYDGVDDGAITSILWMSTSIDSSARAVHIVVEFNGFDAGGSTGGKLVKKLSKSWKSSKSRESL